jgi:hypothetical protein
MRMRSPPAEWRPSRPAGNMLTGRRRRAAATRPNRPITQADPRLVGHLDDGARGADRPHGRPATSAGDRSAGRKCGRKCRSGRCRVRKAQYPRRDSNPQPSDPKKEGRFRRPPDRQDSPSGRAKSRVSPAWWGPFSRSDSPDPPDPLIRNSRETLAKLPDPAKRRRGHARSPHGYSTETPRIQLWHGGLSRRDRSPAFARSPWRCQGVATPSGEVQVHVEGIVLGRVETALQPSWRRRARSGTGRPQRASASVSAAASCASASANSPAARRRRFTRLPVIDEMATDGHAALLVPYNCRDPTAVAWALNQLIASPRYASG